MSTIYDEYEAYTKKYQKEYGQKTIILEQVGSFFEIYSDGTLLDMKEIGDLLNIIVSRKNKSIIEVSRINHLMAGFPLYTLKKFVNVLLNNDFTVVIVEQVSNPPNPRREVTQILSPGTRIDDISSDETNNLMSIYFSEFNDWKTNKDILCVGLSIIDLSTGISKIYETSIDSLNETYRLITVYNPREIVMFGSTKQDVINYLELNNRYVHNKLNIFNKDLLNLNYQREILLKVFKNSGILPIHEYLNIDRLPLATISYIYLLQFSYQHNEHIIDKIDIPTILEFNNTLTLSYNAAKQLNIINNNKNDLLSILNNCNTSIGKRYFKERLLNPMIDDVSINKCYNKIETLLNNKLFVKIANHLNNVHDLERLFRKLKMNKLNPSDFINIDISCTNILNILSIDDDCNNILDFDDFISFYKNHLDLNEIPKYHLDNINGNFFKKDLYLNIDQLQDELNNNISFFNIIIEKFNEDDVYFKVEYNDKDLYHIQSTSKRFNDYKKKHINKTFTFDKFKLKLDELTIKIQTTNVKLSHTYFDKINNNINDLKEQINQLVLNKYEDFLNTIVNKYTVLFDNIIKYVKDIDFLTTCAKNAFNFKYSKPTLISSDKSFIDAKNIRHPIIERINPHLPYIGNDLILGKETDGILLYGVNSSGKSSFSKSIALCIIMSQAGMFVPCDSMIFSPYKKIFSRIPTGDDMFKGLSTFSVEICELRDILKRCDENSLVVGDEIASGTEQISGISIVAASIIQLCEKKTSFIFATHLHDLTGISKINELKNIKIYHLSVKYDELSNKLIYDRHLKEGQGSSIYGIEVCKSLNMSIEFLQLANEIRQNYLDLSSNIVENKKSRYNKKKIVDVCGICNGKASEVHHIKEQALADIDGRIGNIHKNDLHNLLNICSKCHDMIHQDKIKVNGYIQTSEGIELDVVYVYDIINDLKQKNKSMTYILDFIKTNHGISLTKYKVNKIISP
jgi:DNA mismatch repair protein MutS